MTVRMFSEPKKPPVRLVTVASFNDAFVANLAMGRLKAAGIECFIGDQNTVAMDWYYSNAIGGIKLCVNETDVQEALEILRDGRYLPQDVPFVPSCRARHR